MARKTISSTDLIWIFHEKLEAFADCPEGAPIAIVPDFDVGWMAVMSAKSRTQNPVCAGRVEAFRRSFERFMFWRRTNSPLRLSTKDGSRTTFTEWPLGTTKLKLTSAVSALSGDRGAIDGGGKPRAADACAHRHAESAQSARRTRVRSIA